MPTVEVSFTALPAHVRTARLVALAVARRAGVSDQLLDEVRLAVGEACSRGVGVHQSKVPDQPVLMRLTDEQDRFVVEVVDGGPLEHEVADADLTALDTDELSAPAQDATADQLPDLLPPGFGLAVISGLVEDVNVVSDADGTHVRMTWPAPDVMPPDAGCPAATLLLALGYTLARPGCALMAPCTRRAFRVQPTRRTLMSPQALVPQAADAAHVSGGDYGILVVVAVVAVFALLVAGFFAREVLAFDQGTPRMQDISRAVQEGAAAYLRRQFTTLAPFAVIIFALLFILPADTTGSRIGRSVFFLIGAAFSAFVGFAGMTLATRANVRMAAAANSAGAKPAMRVAFRSGDVVGMLTVGLGLLGASVVTLAFNKHAPQVLEGFGFGAALLAMFMRVGGGIFTKAADVGADLVGKVEQGIPEDDPRNAATIADNVGDNVGDCAGMAADLFESYAVTLVASLILGAAAFNGSKIGAIA